MKPSDVTQEAWDAAAEVVKYCTRYYQQDAAARAIMAATKEENAACLKLVEDKAKSYRDVPDEDADFCHPVAVRLEGIAAAIRKRTEDGNAE